MVKSRVWELTDVPGRARGSFGVLWRALGRASARYQAASDNLERFIPWLSIAGLSFGLLLGASSERFSSGINSLMSGFIDGYTWVAPVVIFAILAPTVSNILGMRKSGAIASHALLALSYRRLLACIWAAVFTWLVLGLPVVADQSSGIGPALTSSLGSLADTAIRSPYLWAIYGAFALALISRRYSPLSAVLNRGASAIEHAGSYLLILTPFFMVAVGGYLFSLPTAIGAELTDNGGSVELQNLTVVGVGLDPNSRTGILSIYLVIAFLVGLCSILWHAGWLAWTHHAVKGFSIKHYLTKYWIRIYPLLWATSSEALSAPLNLYLVKKHFPKVSSEVRRLVVGMGSYLNINGTIIAVFVFMGAVGKIVGAEISLLQLMLVVPLVFLLAYSVPGIPSELLLFAGPLAAFLDLGGPTLSAFLLLYIGLQVGLSDSFRTGNNSTDDCLFALQIEEAREKRGLA
ncbi:MAG: cation:dicarboxylase symporter family transporter [Dehalococcoidia bacterium]